MVFIICLKVLCRYATQKVTEEGTKLTATQHIWRSLFFGWQEIKLRKKHTSNPILNIQSDLEKNLI